MHVYLQTAGVCVSYVSLFPALSAPPACLSLTAAGANGTPRCREAAERKVLIRDFNILNMADSKKTVTEEGSYNFPAFFQLKINRTGNCEELVNCMLLMFGSNFKTVKMLEN